MDEKHQLIETLKREITGDVEVESHHGGRCTIVSYIVSARSHYFAEILSKIGHMKMFSLKYEITVIEAIFNYLQWADLPPTNCNVNFYKLLYQAAIEYDITSLTKFAYDNIMKLTRSTTDAPHVYSTFDDEIFAPFKAAAEVFILEVLRGQLGFYICQRCGMQIPMSTILCTNNKCGGIVQFKPCYYLNWDGVPENVLAYLMRKQSNY